jgi:putative oxidoreductase
MADREAHALSAVKLLPVSAEAQRNSVFLKQKPTMSYITHESVLVFTLRVVLGILFFFQGYDKVFRVKVSGVTAFFREESKHRNVPDFMLGASAAFTSWVELIGGALLIVGLFKTAALYLLAVDMILVAAAFSLLKPMWDMQQVFPRLILLGALLYLPYQWDMLSLDYLLRW